MSSRYWQALMVATFGAGIVIWAWLDGGNVSDLALILGSAAIPTAALLFVSGRLERNPPLIAALGGGTVGVAIAVLSAGFVFVFAYAFFFGFAQEAVSLLDALRVDPRFSTALGSPWTILLLIELVVVAPLSEELGKAVGSRLFRPTDRQSAFLAGVAAGTGFAIVENIMYALGGGFFGSPWEAIVIARMMGAAVHPLASGLVVLGWWEWRQHHDLGQLANRFFSGVGVHALWNGSIVVLGIATTAFDIEDGYADFTLVSIAYVAALGALTAAVLWRVTVAVAGDRDRLLTLDSGDGRVLAGWTVLAASLLIPMAMLILAFPDFIGGG